MTWGGIVWTPQLRREDAQRRRRDTFGGYVWFPADKPMSSLEVVAEVRWLLEGGVHPVMVAAALHRSVTSLERLLRRRGEPEASVFSVYAKFERKAAA